MPSQFQLNRDNAYRDVMLSLDYHAERVLLLLGVGLVDTQAEFDELVNSARAARLYMTCSIDDQEEEPTYRQEERYQQRDEEIQVLCCRSAFATNSDGDLLRGLPEPTLKDGILRTVGEDPDQRVYLFRGEVKDRSTAVHRLTFRRFLRFRAAITTTVTAPMIDEGFEMLIDEDDKVLLWV